MSIKEDLVPHTDGWVGYRLESNSHSCIFDLYQRYSEDLWQGDSGPCVEMKDAFSIAGGSIKCNGCIDLHVDAHFCNGPASVVQLHTWIQHVLTAAYQELQAVAQWEPVGPVEP